MSSVNLVLLCQWIPGSGRSPGEGNGSPLQYSCLGNPLDRGAWRAAVHGATKSRTQMSYWTHTVGRAPSRLSESESAEHTHCSVPGLLCCGPGYRERFPYRRALFPVSCDPKSRSRGGPCCTAILVKPLLCSKLPSNSAAKNNLHSSSHGFCGLGICAWHSWVPLG